MGCKNGHVTRHKEAFHTGFKGENTADTARTAKWDTWKMKGRGCEINVVGGIKDVTKRGRGKHAAVKTGKRQKLRSNRGDKNCEEDMVGRAGGKTRLCTVGAVRGDRRHSRL